MVRVVDKVTIVGAYVLLCLVKDIFPYKTDVECIVLEKRFADRKVKTMFRLRKTVHHVIKV